MGGNSCALFSWKCWVPTAASAEQYLLDLLHSEQILPLEQGIRKRCSSLQKNKEIKKYSTTYSGSNKLDISLCHLSKQTKWKAIKYR